MLIASGLPADLPIAMLASGGPERLADILKRAANLKGGDRQQVLSELVQLCGLRSLQQPLIMELKSMLSPNDTFLMIPQVQDMVRNAERGVLVQVLRDLMTSEIPHPAQMGRPKAGISHSRSDPALAAENPNRRHPRRRPRKKALTAICPPRPAQSYSKSGL